MGFACSDHAATFSALIDNELGIQEQTILEDHFLDCSKCTTEYSQLKAFEEILGNNLRAASELTPELWEHMASKLPQLCFLIRDEFSPFLDGELTRAAQEGVRVHLGECAACVKEFRRLNTTNRMIVKEFELPGRSKIDLWPSIKARLNDSCNIIESELSAFIDQEMPMQRHRDITAHILECSVCRDSVRNFSYLGDIISESYLPNIPHNLNLVSGVKAKMKVVHLTPRERTRAARSLYLPIGGAVLLAWLVGAFFIANCIFGAGKPVISSGDYLINATFAQPSELSEAVVYER